MKTIKGVFYFWLIAAFTQPSIQEYFAEMTVDHNDDVILQCGYSQEVEVLKPWKHDGQELPNSDRYSYLYDKTFLKIAKIKESDGGIYTCPMVDEGGKPKDVKIKVIVNPQSFRAHMLPPDPVVYKVLGKDLVAQCVVADLDPGSHLVSIKWIDPEGQDVSAQNSPRTTIEQATSEQSTLLIKNLRSTDAGKYTCKIETSKDSYPRIKKVQLELKLYELSTSLISSHHKYMGTNLYNILECPEQSEDNTVIAWELDGKDLYNEMILGNTAYNIWDWGMSVRLNATTDGMIGIYTCRIRDKTTGVITEYRINATAAEFAEIKVPRSEISARPNSQVLLGCEVRGYPKPIISWRFQKTDIMESDRHKITEEGLLISDLKESDSGTYYCMAEQGEMYHRDNKKIKLIVKHVTNEDIFELLEKNQKSLEELLERNQRSLKELLEKNQQYISYILEDIAKAPKTLI